MMVRDATVGSSSRARLLSVLRHYSLRYDSTPRVAGAGTNRGDLSGLDRAARIALCFSEGFRGLSDTVLALELCPVLVVCRYSRSRRASWRRSGRCGGCGLDGRRQCSPVTQSGTCRRPYSVLRFPCLVQY